MLLRCSKRNAVTKSEGRWFSLYVLGIKCSEKTIRTIETIKTIETFKTFKTIKMVADNV